MLSVLHTLTGNEFVGLEVRRRLKKAAHVGRKVAIVILVVILLVFTRIITLREGGRVSNTSAATTYSTTGFNFIHLGQHL